MSIEIIFAPEAESDIQIAYEWYEDKRIGLGEEFLNCIDASINLIQRHPEVSNIVFENYRRCLIRRFPYAIFYEHKDKFITIYAVFHTSQNPKKWQERLK